MCTNNIKYTMGHEASEWIYKELRNQYRILFYSGDTDGAVPTHGTLMWMQELGWDIINYRRPYYVYG